MEKKITGFDYLWLALYAFAGIGFELVLVNLIEPLFGVSMETYTTAQGIIHWIVTCLVWLAVGVLLIRLAQKKYGFSLWENNSGLKFWQYAGIVVCLTVAVVSHFMDWGGFKPLLEFQNLGILKFIFQYIYYLFEVFLFSLIIIFG